MKNFKYTAIDLKKKKYTGLYMAENEKDLAAQLARQNLFLISCTPYSGKTPSAFFTTGTGKVNTAELSNFCRQISIMLNTGVPVVGALETLKDQSFSAFFKNLIRVIYEDVRGGTILSESLNKHKKVFPDFFRSMVYVGEAGGKLDAVFDSLADYYEKEGSIKQKVRGALAYPIMLVFMTIAIVALMLIFIIPTFKSTLADLEVVPEGFTKVVYDLSDFISTNWLNILAVIIVLGLAVFGFAKTKAGTSFFDRLALKTPIIGKVQIALMSARFARSFSLLLSSGMDVSDALDAASVVISNAETKRRYNDAVEDIKHGMPLSFAFEHRKIFPPMLLQMIAIGEKTAQLEDVMRRSCHFFDEQSESTLLSVTAKIQPILLCIMGAIIGTLFVAVYSPLLSIITQIR